MKKSVINLSLFPEIPAKIENYSNGQGGRIYKKMRERPNNRLRCENCLFYHLDDEENGTCEINDIIVEGTQNACVGYHDKTTGK